MRNRGAEFFDHFHLHFYGANLSGQAIDQLDHVLCFAIDEYSHIGGAVVVQTDSSSEDIRVLHES